MNQKALKIKSYIKKLFFYNQKTVFYIANVK